MLRVWCRLSCMFLGIEAHSMGIEAGLVGIVRFMHLVLSRKGVPLDCVCVWEGVRPN